MFQLGKEKFRSPVDVDITQYKIDPILARMRTNGISDYEIFTEEPNKIIGSGKNKVIVIDSKTEELDRLNSKVEKLENLLFDLLEQNDKKNREQNNKDVDILPKVKDVVIKSEEQKSEPNEKIKIVKKPKKTKKKNIIREKKSITIPNPNPVVAKEPKKIESIRSEKKNKANEFKDKKIVIEELEDVKDINIKLDGLGNDTEMFKPKPFDKKMAVKKPFEISSDVEMLKKFKKK